MKGEKAKKGNQSYFLGYQVIINKKRGFIDLVLAKDRKKGYRKSIRLNDFMLDYLRELNPSNLSEAFRSAIKKAMLYDLKIEEQETIILMEREITMEVLD